MKKIEFKNNIVELYDSAEVLPIKRYQRFNKYLMIDNEVGSCFEDFDKRTMKIIELLKKDLKNEAVIEMENRRQMVFNSYENYSPKNLALAILVYSINGVVFNDYSESKLDEIVNELDKIGFTKILMDQEIDEVKKKSKTNWILTLKGMLTKQTKLKITVV